MPRSPGEQSFRPCKNSKSRANPDVQCPLSATHGDYCSRHYKNPKPFAKPPKISTRPYTRSESAAIKQLQRFWRRWAPLHRFRCQGPAANLLSVATNQTELYSFDPIDKIPQPYLLTLVDERRSLWAFDIRTLVHSMTKGSPSQNPYTRDPFTDQAKQKIHARIEWLRRRKYHILHINTDTVSPEQMWKHKVLDIFLRIESLGYYVSCEWFHRLTQDQHKQFYATLFSLWSWKLQLTQADKDRIVPTNGAELFRFHPDDTPAKSQTWWQKTTLSLMDTFISKGATKEDKKMGAMYALMALTAASSAAAEGLPWLVA